MRSVRDRASEALCRTTSWIGTDPEPVFVRGRAASVWDDKGEHWIDFVGGHSALNFGHSFPPFVDIATEQLCELTHASNARSRWQDDLAIELLRSFDSEKECQVVFNTSGARAIETAWKAVHAFRPGKLVTLAPSLHGRSIATASISETKRATISAAMQPYVHVWSGQKYPACHVCPWETAYPGCELPCAAEFTTFLEENSDSISAVLLEPALTARGYVFPPGEFFRRIRQATQKCGIVLIADEIQTGLGRCSSFLLSRDQGWEPDLAVLAKSLGEDYFQLLPSLDERTFSNASDRA